MRLDEMELVGRLGDVEPLPPEVSERAKMVLRAAMAVDAAPEPMRLATDRRRRRSRDRERPVGRGLRPRRVLAGVAVSAAVVAGVGVYLAGGSASIGTHSGLDSGHSTGTAAARFQTVAYVTRRAVAAAANASADVVEVRTARASGSTFDDWFGPVNGSNQSAQYRMYGAGGQLLSEITFTASSLTSVDYGDHTWWTESRAASPSTSGLIPAREAFSVMPPSKVETLLQSGGFSRGSTGTIDGQPVVTLTKTLENGATLTLSFDQTNYQLLQAQAAGSSDPDDNYQTDFTYTAPTTVNLANVNATIPKGFTQVSAPAELG